MTTYFETNQLEQEFKNKNNTPLEDFEGYSPCEMFAMINQFNPKHCPVKLQKITSNDLVEVPIFNIAKHLIRLIEETKEIKLTPKENLPLKVVKEIYAAGYCKSEMTAISGGRNEDEFRILKLARLLLTMGGVIKKVKKKLSLTQKGAKIIKDDQMLFLTLFDTYMNKFNSSYFDQYEFDWIGNGDGFYNLLLVAKYGDTPREDNFYAKKYFKAFPVDITNGGDVKFNDMLTFNPLHICYSYRVFSQFMTYFGLIEEISRKSYLLQIELKKTAFFDKFIKLTPHTKHNDMIVEID